MTGQVRQTPPPGSVTSLTVHGPGGVLDLTVPVDATLADVARVYAAEARLPVVLPLVSTTGGALPMDTPVADIGLASGSLLVAVDPLPTPSGAGRSSDAARTGTDAPRGAGVWLMVAVGFALTAAFAAIRLPEDDRWPVVAVLAAAAVLGCVPSGRMAAQRVLAAPAFAVAATLTAVWDPVAERLPFVLGAAALAGAVTAALGRSFADPDAGADEGLRVWMWVGGGGFALTGLATLTAVDTQVVWGVAYLLAVLAARFVPEFAIDVPDQYLIDFERLAVTAWSARERPTGRRGRIIVPEHAVAAVAARGARTMTAASVAIVVVTLLCAPLLIWSTDVDLDRTGARCLLVFGGGTLLLAARNHRHEMARRLLRVAGVASLTVVAFVVLDIVGPRSDPGVVPGPPGWVGLGTAIVIAVAALLVLIAVLVGRGWRSAWWSRRAEIAEAICGSFAVASLVVAIGFFRHLWEVTG